MGIENRLEDLVACRETLDYVFERAQASNDGRMDKLMWSLEQAIAHTEDAIGELEKLRENDDLL